jgi:hypothetical protein
MHLMRIHEEQRFTPDDLPGYAAKVFDWAMANLITECPEESVISNQ